MSDTRLRVLTYHRVADPQARSSLNPLLISTTPAAFDRQMAYLAQRYTVVSMADVLRAVATDRRLPRRAVLLTFDDAYHDFAASAWPVLKRYRLPVTLFVPTGYPDQPHWAFWSDRLYHALTRTHHTALQYTPWGTLPLQTARQRHASIQRLRHYLYAIPHVDAERWVEALCNQLGQPWVPQHSVLSWDELRQLAREGVTLASHTHTHAVLTQLSPDQIRAEIRAAQHDLQREIGCLLPVFCYPRGAHNETVVRILRDAGYVLAFTTCDGQNDLQSADLLRLRRTDVTRRTAALPIFRLRLTRLGATLDRWRHGE
jgi:peptidoglycan/xylan/chitin deacetylase (PgdA/CDA1 family)